VFDPGRLLVLSGGEFKKINLVICISVECRKNHFLLFMKFGCLVKNSLAKTLLREKNVK